jgi:hypothetical protein
MMPYYDSDTGMILVPGRVFIYYYLNRVKEILNSMNILQEQLKL